MKLYRLNGFEWLDDSDYAECFGAEVWLSDRSYAWVWLIEYSGGSEEHGEEATREEAKGAANAALAAYLEESGVITPCTADDIAAALDV